MTDRIFHFLGICSCWGAQIRACEKGPEDLLKAHILERLKNEGIPIDGIETLYPLKRALDEECALESSLPLIHEVNLRLATRVTQVLQEGQFPIVFGGDHANAVGTWNGVRRFLAQKSDLPMGLLWIDAHMDAHTPETTPSGAWHGMPIAALLGFGDPRMASLLHKEPVLLPEHLALIGVRSFEKEEAALLERLKVRVYFMEEVKRRGLREVVEEALAKVTQGTSGFGVSLDLDVIDPQEAPGVGSIEEGGLPTKELYEVIPVLGRDPRLSALEIVEFNPERDPEHKTREVVYQLLKQAMQ